MNNVSDDPPHVSRDPVASNRVPKSNVTLPQHYIICGLIAVVMWIPANVMGGLILGTRDILRPGGGESGLDGAHHGLANSIALLCLNPLLLVPIFTIGVSIGVMCSFRSSRVALLAAAICSLLLEFIFARVLVG